MAMFNSKLLVSQLLNPVQKDAETVTVPCAISVVFEYSRQDLTHSSSPSSHQYECTNKWLFVLPIQCESI